jgi:hypothetical protein
VQWKEKVEMKLRWGLGLGDGRFKLDHFITNFAIRYTLYVPSTSVPATSLETSKEKLH